MKLTRIGILLFLLLLSACGLMDEQTEQDAPTPIAPTPTAELVVAEETETAVNEEDEEEVPSLEIEENVQQLIIWLPPSFADEVDVVGETAVFQQQLQIFTENHPDIEIVVEEKEVEGSGGMFDYLRTGRPIAPAILPHLLILPVERLPVATEAGLLQPLSAHLPAGAMGDLYPAAQEMVDVDGELMGYPIFVNDLTHMVSERDIFIEGLEPIRWRSMVAKEAVQFVFPAAGIDGTLLLLQTYLAEGGHITDEDGVPILEIEPLTKALSPFEDGSQEGIIIPESRTMTSLDEVWPYLLEGEGATVAQTNAVQFLQHQPSLDNIIFAAIPGPVNNLTPLLNGWAWALPHSPDEAAQIMAADLLAFLSEPEQLAVWSEESGILPANREALANWSTADTPYIQFVDSELEGADEMPIAEHSTIMIALSDAIFNVVSLNQTAVEAAQTAVSTVSP